MKITTLMQSEQYNTVKSDHLNLVLDHWVRDVVYSFLKPLKYSAGVLKLSKRFPKVLNFRDYPMEKN